MPETNYGEEKLEAQKRFEALPENLKREMLADKNIRTIVSVSQDYKLSEEDMKKSRLVGGRSVFGLYKTGGDRFGAQ